MISKTLRLARPLAAVLLWTACGSNDDDSMNTGMTGSNTSMTGSNTSMTGSLNAAGAPAAKIASSVDDKTPVPKLTDADAETLCEYKYELAKPTLKGADMFCNYLAANTSQSTAECKQRKDSCLADKLYEQQEAGILQNNCRTWLASDFGMIDSTRCTATVADVKKCWAWAFDQSIAEMAKASCNNPGRSSVSLSTGPCGDLLHICPGYSLLM